MTTRTNTYAAQFENIAHALKEGCQAIAQDQQTPFPTPQGHRGTPLLHLAKVSEPPRALVGLPQAYMFDENNKPNFVATGASQASTQQSALSSAYTAETAARTIRMTTWCKQLNHEDNCVIIEAARNLANLTATEHTRHEVYTHLANDAPTLLCLAQLAANHPQARDYATTTIYYLCPQITASLLLVNQALPEYLRTGAINAIRDLVHEMSAPEMLLNPDSVAAGQSRAVMRSLLCVEFEVWQIMHPDVFVALILAFSRMLHCQDEGVAAHASQAARALVGAAQPVLEGLLRRASSGTSACAAYVQLLSGVMLAIDCWPDGPMVDPVWEMLRYFASHPQGLRYLFKEDLQMKVYRKVPSCALSLMGNQHFADDIANIVVTQLIADLSTHRVGRALLVLEILMVDEDTTLSMLSHIVHPGFFVVNLAHLISQSNNQAANYANPEGGPTVIRDTSRKLLRMLLATPPLLRYMTADHVELHFQEPMAEMMNAVSVLLADISEKGRTAGLDSYEINLFYQLLSTIFKIASHKPKEFVLQLVLLGIFSDVIKGVSNAMNCMDFDISMTALRILRLLSESGSLQSVLLQGCENGDVPQGEATAQHLVATIASRLTSNRQLLTQQEMAYMTECLFVLKSMVSAESGSVVLKLVLGEPIAPLGPLHKANKAAAMGGSMILADVMGWLGFDSSSSDASASERTPHESMPRVVSTTPETPFSPFKGRPVETLIKGVLNMLTDMNDVVVDASLSILVEMLKLPTGMQCLLLQHPNIVEAFILKLVVLLNTKDPRNPTRTMSTSYDHPNAEKQARIDIPLRALIAVQYLVSHKEGIAALNLLRVPDKAGLVVCLRKLMRTSANSPDEAAISSTVLQVLVQQGGGVWESIGIMQGAMNPTPLSRTAEFLAPLPSHHVDCTQPQSLLHFRPPSPSSTLFAKQTSDAPFASLQKLNM